MSLDFSLLLREDAHEGRPRAKGGARCARPLAHWSPLLRLLAAAVAVTLTSLAAALVVATDPSAVASAEMVAPRACGESARSPAEANADKARARCETSDNRDSRRRLSRGD